MPARLPVKIAAGTLFYAPLLNEMLSARAVAIVWQGGAATPSDLAPLDGPRKFQLRILQERK